MSKQKNKSDFNAMNVAELKKYLQDRGVSVSGYLKPSLVEIASAVERMVLPVDPNFENDRTSEGGKLIIHDMVIPDPFSLKTANNFNSSPPFGLFDIFNHLIYHSTDYDKQGLAAYKSFEDYRLFHDGYVESLLTAQLNQEGVHVYVAKVRPFMKIKTDEGKEYYDLWFILEGRGANRGSVLQAKCKCKGGRDGGCKHIAAAMYALEDLLNTRGDHSVTSGPCIWVKRPRANTQACEVKNLLIEKGKIPSHKKRKRKHVYSQNIDADVRAPEDTNPPDEEYLRKFTKKMCQFKNDTPVILPLLQKLYSTPEADTDLHDNIANSKSNRPETSIMNTKLHEILRNDPNMSTEEVFKLLSFSDEEREQVEGTTLKQWQCEEWYLHKSGFITASKCKRVFTRQETLEKNIAENATKLVEAIALSNSPRHIQSRHQETEEMEPQNAREWGLFHEETARKAYQRVASHTHHKLKLVSKGFLISKLKPFLGASVDNIQKCQCSHGCLVRVVEYKCPWKHRDLHPKEAFLTPEIGGIKNGDKFTLKPSSQYYFQVQLQMFVSELTLCTFVVWTKKGIFTVEVPYDQSFMSNVCAKLEKFWTSQVLPFMMTEVSRTLLPAHDSVQEVCYSQDSGSSQETISSAQQPCCQSEVVITSSQGTCSPEQADAGTSQTSCIEIDLSQYSTPATSSKSVEISGLQIYKEDVQTVQPMSMITDTIVLFLFKQLPQCVYPIVSTFFYTTLCGEQDVGHTTSRMVRQTSAEKFFKADLLNSKYVFIPINRSLHWLLAVLTPGHLLILDSLTWDISTRHHEIDNINSFLDHLCAASSTPSKTRQRSNHVLKVPQQLRGSNNCGFHLFMFVDHFLKDLKEYESNPNGYVNAKHQWFDPKDAETKRTLTRTYLEALFVNK